ncbi:hypothetical protein F1880_008401 [Penicillium rolfsii]|nr:hypothetical protein F1880_008401 [Penicillium rolfsii]
MSSNTPSPETSLQRNWGCFRVQHKSSRPKTSYQFAYPPPHAHYTRFRLQPKLLLQLQQLSPACRPTPIIDVFQSAVYPSLVTRKITHPWKRGNVLRSNHVVASFSQTYDTNMRSSKKASIVLNPGPVLGITRLPSGSYDIIAMIDNRVRVMRWALRGRKSNRNAGIMELGMRDTKRFTFSFIDPSTHQHAVIASMCNNRLEVNDEYFTPVARPSTSPRGQNSSKAVVDNMSDTRQLAHMKEVVTLDDVRRTLILVTGVCVALMEGWSRNVEFDSHLSKRGDKGLVPFQAKYRSLSQTKRKDKSCIDHNEMDTGKKIVNGKRSMSSSSNSGVDRVANFEGSKSKGLRNIMRPCHFTAAAVVEEVKRWSTPIVKNLTPTFSGKSVSNGT